MTAVAPTINSSGRPARPFPAYTRAYFEVSEEVRAAGLMERAPGFYAAVGTIIACAFAAAIWTSVAIGDSWWQLAIAAVFGFLFTQVAFVAHEAAHRQIFSGGKANDRLAVLVAGAVVGMSYSWWMNKHSRHHKDPNQIGRDPDIAVDVIAFVADDAATSTGVQRWVQKRQGWLFFPLLMLEGINLHFQSMRYLFSREPRSGRWLELSLIAFRFGALLIPLFLMLPLPLAVAFLGVQLAVFGVYMGASFAPNHKGMPLIAPDERPDFFSRQVRTSRNISGGAWASFFYGGLNYQVEHHLFPSMARPHLARAREIVRRQCQRLDVPYAETTALQSYGIVVRYLNEVGLAARDPFDCPVRSMYRPR